ncbi:MAG: PASTA domain-containing protein [Acidimicrobiales bacterium]
MTTGRLRLIATPVYVLASFVAAVSLASCSASSSSTSTTKNAPRTTSTTQVAGASTVAVPNVVGEPMDQAVSAVQASGLQPGGIQVDPTGPKTSVVLSTSPAAGTQVPQGSKVIFNIGSGN